MPRASRSGTFAAKTAHSRVFFQHSGTDSPSPAADSRRIGGKARRTYIGYFTLH